MFEFCKSVTKMPGLSSILAQQPFLSVQLSLASLEFEFVEFTCYSVLLAAFDMIAMVRTDW